MAIFYQNLGKLNESKKFYLKAIELSPKRISIYFNLSRIDKNFIDDEKVKYLSNLMSNEKQEQSEMSYGYFILAEDQRKKKNYDKLNDILKISFRQRRKTIKNNLKTFYIL